MTEYKIKGGDTLSRLAKKFGTTVSELAKANNITDPDKIYVGDNLTVPDNQQKQLQALVQQLLPTMSQPSPGMENTPPQLQPQGVRQPPPPQGIPSPQSQALQSAAPEAAAMGVPGLLRGAGGLAMGGLAGLARGMPPQLAKAGRMQPPQGYSNIVPMGNSGAANSSMAQAMLRSKGSGVPEGAVGMDKLLQMLRSRGNR